MVGLTLSGDFKTIQVIQSFTYFFGPIQKTAIVTPHGNSHLSRFGKLAQPSIIVSTYGVTGLFQLHMPCGAKGE